MKILISGGTGFVGQAIIRDLLRDGHEIVMLRRPGSRSRAISEERVSEITVDLERPISAGDLDGDAIINVAGIIREFPSKGVTFYKTHLQVNKNLIDFAHSRGIRRYLMMSALGVYSNFKTGYQETKYQGEQYLHDSGLNWTIFRPSLIFGPDCEFTRMLTNMIRRFPAVPVVGDGQYKLQPVWIGDVAAGFKKAICDSRSFGMTYEFGGPEILKYDRLLDIIGDVLGYKRVRKVHLPPGLLRPIASLFERFPWFPLANDQITMLLESNYTEDNTYFEMFKITPKKFRDGLLEYLR